MEARRDRCFPQVLVICPQPNTSSHREQEGITNLIKQERDIEGRDHHSTVSETEVNLLQAKTRQNTVSQTKQKFDLALGLGEHGVQGLAEFENEKI